MWPESKALCTSDGLGVLETETPGGTWVVQRSLPSAVFNLILLVPVLFSTISWISPDTSELCVVYISPTLGGTYFLFGSFALFGAVICFFLISKLGAYEPFDLDAQD